MEKGHISVVKGRITEWVEKHIHILRLVFTSIGLAGFLCIIPNYIQKYFWYGFLSHKILTGMLFTFSLVATSLIWSASNQFDIRIFLFLNVRGKRPMWLDTIMAGVTQVGSGFAAVGIALIFFFSGFRLFAYELILGSLFLWLIVELLKLIFHRGRPFIHLSQARIVGNMAAGRSFPSGHTSQAFFLVTLITQYFHSSVWTAVFLFSSALVIGITRIYVGAHYPRDVLAGAVLGTAWGLIGMIIIGYIQ